MKFRVKLVIHLITSLTLVIGSIMFVVAWTLTVRTLDNVENRLLVCGSVLFLLGSMVMLFDFNRVNPKKYKRLAII